MSRINPNDLWSLIRNPIIESRNVVTVCIKCDDCLHFRVGGQIIFELDFGDEFVKLAMKSPLVLRASRGYVNLDLRVRSMNATVEFNPDNPWVDLRHLKGMVIAWMRDAIDEVVSEMKNDRRICDLRKSEHFGG